VIATQHLSEATRIVLHRAHLLARFATDPEGALASLHRTLAAAPADPDVLFALAEMSFLQALSPGQQPHALAAAVYAYAFLFPADPHQRPSGFDPRMRTACDIYNRSLIRAFASADGARFDVQTGRYPLAFGSLDGHVRSDGALGTTAYPTLRPPMSCASPACRSAIVGRGSARRRRRCHPAGARTRFPS
jgi:hypothetical protein